MNKKDQSKLVLAVLVLVIAAFCLYWFTLRESTPAAADPAQGITQPETTATPPGQPSAPTGGGGSRRVAPGTP